MSKRAIILAGGRGTRLRPYTVVLPKPLMPIGEYPILEVILRQLISHGFDHITMAVNHQADLIKSFFNDGAKWGVKIDYSLEEKPLGTMGPLQKVEALPDNFLVMNGDVLTDLDFSKFYHDHSITNQLFTISSFSRDQKIDYGVLEKDSNNYLRNFIEKPLNQYEVSMGIYMINKKILDYIPVDIQYGFDNLMLDLIDDKKKVSVQTFNGYWLDIGRPDDYMKAIDEFDQMKSRFINE
jgi:NDP-mannose synthase